MGNKGRQPAVSSETKFNRLSEDAWGKGGGVAGTVIRLWVV